MSQLPARFIGNEMQGQQEYAGDFAAQSPQQPQTFPSAIHAELQQERVKNFLSQTSPTDTLERLNYILKGFVYDESAKDWIKVSDGIPEKIRLDFLQFITTDLSEDVRMTNLGTKQINGVMESSIEWVVDYLDDVADDEDFSETQMTKIGWMMIKAIFYALLRGENGIERARLYNSLNLSGTPDMPVNFNNNNKRWYQFWR